MLQINSMPDHIHIFIGMCPHQSISALVQNVKTESSKCLPERNGQGSKLTIFAKACSVGRRVMALFLIPNVMCPMWYATSTGDVFLWICSYQFAGGNVERKKETVMLMR
jgi:REP element-mobilizing transposase RayT